MRLAVLDVGSNAAHLQVVDARPGGLPQPVFRLKAPTLLADEVTADGAVSAAGVERLVSAVTETVSASRRHAVTDLIPLATATIRDASNVEEIRARVRAAAGIELRSLSGEDEARVTFLAVRRWLGQPARALLLLDVGGATTEIAAGAGETPELAVSLPLGAGRLTRALLPSHPAQDADVAAVRGHVRALVEPVATRVRAGMGAQPGDLTYIATSKTFKQLARVTGGGDRLTLERLHEWVPRLAAMSAEQRAELPGAARSRSRQLLAGAVVAETLMECLDVAALEVCPWALREGLLLRRIAELTGTPGQCRGARHSWVPASIA